MKVENIRIENNQIKWNASGSDAGRFCKVQIFRIHSERNEFVHTDYVENATLDILPKGILPDDGNYEMLLAWVTDEQTDTTGPESFFKFYLEKGNLFPGTNTKEFAPTAPEQTTETSAPQKPVPELKSQPKEKEGFSMPPMFSFDAPSLSLRIGDTRQARWFMVEVRIAGSTEHIFYPTQFEKRIKDGQPLAIYSYRLTELQSQGKKILPGEFLATMLALDKDGNQVETADVRFSLNQKQVEIINNEIAAKQQANQSNEVAKIEDLAIVDVGNNKGGMIRWRALASNKYLVRVVQLDYGTSTMIIPDETLDINRVQLGGLTTRKTYKVSVAGYNLQGQRGPWKSLIFHMEDGKMIPGYAAQKKQGSRLPFPPHTVASPQNPLPPTPAPQAKEQGKKEEPALSLQPDPAVQRLEEELRKEREESAKLRQTVQDSISRMLATAQSQATSEQMVRELEQRTATEREEQERRENDRQARFDQTVQELRKETEELRRAAAAKTANLTSQTIPAAPPIQQPNPPTTPAAPTTAQGGTGNQQAQAQVGNTPTNTRRNKLLVVLAVLLILGGLVGLMWFLKPKASTVTSGTPPTPMIDQQMLERKLSDLSNMVAGVKAPLIVPSSPADIQVGDEKINVRPTDPSGWANKGGKVSHSGNTTTAHTIIGVVNNGEIKNSTIRVMSSEVWTSEWTPTLPTVTCGKEVPAGTNEFVIGPREVQCIMVPRGWIVQPCLEDLVNVDMMCGDGTVARTYLPGTKEQVPLKGNQMRFRLKAHITEEVTVRFKVIAP